VSLDAVGKLIGVEREAQVFARAQVQFLRAGGREVVREYKILVAAELAVRRVQLRRRPRPGRQSRERLSEADVLARSVRAAKQVEAVPREAQFAPEAPAQVDAVYQLRLHGVGWDVPEDA
jgi:hypothetical protein